MTLTKNHRGLTHFCGVLSACLFAMTMLVGCGGYPQVSSHAYGLATALYSTCNRSDTARLGRIAELTEAARTKAEITDQEAKWLHQIIAQAESGKWDVAAAESRLLLESQVVGR